MHRLYAVIYEWIKGIDAVQAYEQAIIDEDQMVSLTLSAHDRIGRLGFEVLDIQGLNVEDGEAMGRITRECLKDFALSVDRPDADAIFVSCGGIRTIDVLQEIEDAAGKPVVCSNQAMMWDCLRRAGIADRIARQSQIGSSSNSLVGLQALVEQAVRIDAVPGGGDRLAVRAQMGAERRDRRQQQQPTE